MRLRRALRQLPVARADGIAKLLDEPDPIGVRRGDDDEIVLLDDSIDTGGAARADDRVLADLHPWILVDDRARRATDLGFVHGRGPRSAEDRRQANRIQHSSAPT